MDNKTREIIEKRFSNNLCTLKDDDLFTLQDITESKINNFCIKYKVSKGEVVQTLYKYMRKTKKGQYFSQYLVDWFPELLSREDTERPTYREVSLYYDLYREESRISMEKRIRDYCQKYNVPIEQIVAELNIRMKKRNHNSKNFVHARIIRVHVSFHVTDPDPIHGAYLFHHPDTFRNQTSIQALMF